MNINSMMLFFLKILKLFLPSWAFFEQSGTCLRIEFKKQDDEEYSQPTAANSRRMRHIFLNPLHNKKLALFSAMERLIQNLDNDKYDFSKDEDFRTLKIWTEFETQSSPNESSFRILAKTENSWEVLLDSQIIEKKWTTSF